MMLRNMLTTLLPHGVYMVYLWMIYELKGRIHSKSIVIAWTTCNSIYRIAIQWGLLIEFCYDSKLEVLSSETTLVLSNTRELNRVPNTK